MKINHLALWVKDMEGMKDFYIQYFGVEASKIYTNQKKGFSSYFLTFEDGFRLEIMSITDIKHLKNKSKTMYDGYSHISFSLGSKEEVLQKTKSFLDDGFTIVDGPRLTGDGYFESVILDPEDNRIELTI
ncbi:MAG: VOC family protein [Spirochaetaceae bacterium]|nr:VOC family protein [Spirochaetaceae bacterium]